VVKGGKQCGVAFVMRAQNKKIAWGNASVRHRLAKWGRTTAANATANTT
jgi:hypothetical protein